MTLKTSKHKAAWDRQWRGNLLSTCLLHADREAGRAGVEGWAAFFSKLPEGAKILDAGTGNGFLALIALDVSDRLERNFEIHGSDYAAINPVAAVPEQGELLKRIKFHPETRNEDLPFEDRTFDAVTSQHALEYGDLTKSIEEISRILKKGARVRFLIHAADGEIVRANAPKIAQCRYVLEEIRLFEIAEAAVEEALAGKGDQGRALRKALSETADNFKDDPNTRDLAELLGLLWGAFEGRANFPDFAAFKTWLNQNRLETEAQMLRIEAMQKAALTKQRAEALIAEMKSSGFHEVALREDKDPNTGARTGWLVEGVRG